MPPDAGREVFVMINRRSWLRRGMGLTLHAAIAAPESPSTPGLSSAGGTLFHAGKPFRGIGVNWYELFLRGLRVPEHSVLKPAFHRLVDAGIPCARFNAGGFWPNDWSIYQSDRPRWFGTLDTVIENAERAGLGLIPSLFWHYPAIPDLMAEPIDQFGMPSSRTCQFLREYTRTMVERYRASNAIWGWELGNEWALGADLPNASEARPAILPHLGTPSQRTKRDEFSSSAMLHAMKLVASTIREHDPHRILITGQALPRPSAWHNRHHRSWEPDSQEQWLDVLRADNPHPYDTLCAHLYPQDQSMSPPWAATTDRLVEVLKKESLRLNRTLVIGEFGVPRGVDRPVAAFDEILDAMERHQVPLALLWVYDLPSQDRDWNVSLDDDRAWQLERILKYNQKTRAI
jgi:hypothetical protein